jgi:carbamoyltransferase
VKILGVNTSHHASVAEVEDGRVISVHEEARFNRVKNFEPKGQPYRFSCIDEKIDLTSIDHVIVSSFDARTDVDPTGEQDWTVIRALENQTGKPVEFHLEHHLYHALSGFYFSGLDEALCVVLDGGGAQVLPDYPRFQEVESAYYVTRSDVVPIFKHLTNRRFLESGAPKLRKPELFQADGAEIKLSSTPSSGMNFSTLSVVLGMFGGEHDAGKLMGLAPYGDATEYTASGLCARLQRETEEHTVALLRDVLSRVDTKNVVLSGGYALNCTNNFKYTQRFPDINFFVDPCAHDMGTAAGAALWKWRQCANT